MILSHLISDAVLTSMGIGVFWHYFGQMAFYNRLLWGFFLLTLTLAALTGILVLSGYTIVEPLNQSLNVLAGSFGTVCLVMGVWALVSRRSIRVVPFVVTLILGLFMFVILLLPEIRVFAPVVQSLGILVAMLLAVFGLLRRQVWAVWLVVAVMLMGIATKATAFGQLISPTDFYHYAVALALLGFGKAVEGSMAG